MATAEGSSAPRVMVFRPTYKEMENFMKYVDKMESEGAHKAGIAKVIPPQNWCPRKDGYSDMNLTITAPISQVVKGKEGVYLQSSKRQKSVPLREFRKLAESKYKTPHCDYENLERIYWENITHTSTVYGADVSGTLFDEDNQIFNISRLESVLDILHESSIVVNGVNTSYLYFGTWKSTFAWHTEDMELYSINYLHFGAPKTWYAIPPEHGHRFEQLASEFFPNSFRACAAFLRHKMIIISPEVLKKCNIPFTKMTQRPREFIITFPFGYHAGFNQGYNCAEATNFAMPRWIEYGKRAELCTCRRDSVRINMDIFVLKYQPERYDLWKEGKDVGPHPEDSATHYSSASSSEAVISEDSPMRMTLREILDETCVRRSLGKPEWTVKQSEFGIKLNIVKRENTLSRASADEEMPRHGSIHPPVVHHSEVCSYGTDNSSQCDSEVSPNLPSMREILDETCVRRSLGKPEWTVKQSEFGIKLNIVKRENTLSRASADEETPRHGSIHPPVVHHSEVCSYGTDNSSQCDSDVSPNLPSSSAAGSKDKWKNDFAHRKSEEGYSNSLARVSEDLADSSFSIQQYTEHSEQVFEEEKAYNLNVSCIKPHCAVCVRFHTQTSVLSEYPGAPSSSTVKIPEICFSKSVDNHCSSRSNPLLARDGTSPLLICAGCSVCVHASCYGVTILKHEHWFCTRCAMQARYVQCCLCFHGAGALKPTADGRWAHIVCAIVIPEIVFENVILREPINISQVPERRLRLKCVHCANSNPRLPVKHSNCCVQCQAVGCYVSFHVTCAEEAEASLECRDWPELIHVKCATHCSRKRQRERATC